MSGKKGFNLAGILLFGKDAVIQSCAPGYVTDCLLRRENLDRYDDRLIVETNLIEAYDRVFEFIEKHTLDRFFIIGNQSVSVRSRIAREIVSNILVHREYTSSYRARVIIERDRLVADNWNRPLFEGRIDPDDFTPRSKNPILAKFFVNIGRADELGSGVRNLYEYTKLYTGGAVPEFIEGNVFKTIVPLAGDGDLKVDLKDDLKVDIKVENQLLNQPLPERDVLSQLKAHPEATLPEVADYTGRTQYAVKTAVKSLQAAGLLKRDGSKKKGRWVVIDTVGDGLPVTGESELPYSRADKAKP
jgi:ATP-dependent DNA helicase RecG